MGLTPDQWARVKATFDAAVALDSAERPAYLARACGDDSALRRQVETMLRSHDADATFLETPAAVLVPAPVPDDLIGRVVGPYRLVARIGAGGMGEVYKAEDSKLERPVAVKLISKHLATDPDRLRRFHAEARAASSLNHPHIVVVHDFGEIDGRPFIVTEFVEGQTLRQRLQSGAIPAREALDIASQVAGALAAAHARGLVHRDIKPENVMLRPDGYVKVLDFGLAKLAGPVGAPQTAHTLAGTVMGTPRYMSPEQARGLDVDERSDIWSLGVTLYEMLAGRPPFDGPTPTDVMAAVVRSEPVPLEQAARGTPAPLGALVAQMLAKEASLRFASAQALNSALVAARAAFASTPSATHVDPSVRAPSVAILPFVDMSPEGDQKYFCEGVAEELINALAALPGLRVAARTSLNVDCVLEGSVRKAGTRLRISARLVKVADGFPLWFEQFDRDLDDVFAIQDEIARTIAAKLRVTLPGSGSAPIVKRPTDNPEAYNLYLQGRYLWRQFTAGSPQQAITCFEQAIALDPDYALAYAGLAHVYASLAFYYWTSQRVARDHARAAARRAVELGGDLAQTHASLGWVLLLFEQNALDAERHFRMAIDRNARTVYGHYYLGVLDIGRGRFDDGLARLQRLCDAHPDIVAFHVTLAFGCRQAGEVERAVALCARALEIDDQSPVTMWHYGLALSLADRHEEAIRWCQQGLDRSGRNLFALASLGRVCARAGRHEATRAVIEELRTRAATESVPAMTFAWVHAALNERDAALEALERAYDEHDVQLWWTKHDAVFAPLRDDERFNAILARVYGTAAVDTARDEPVAATAPLVGARASAPPARRMGAWLVAAAAVAAAAVAWTLWPAKAPTMSERDTIVLADIDNKTGDSVFDDTIRTALAIGLRQSPYLRIVPDQRLRETLSLMTKAPDTRIIGDVAREVCEREGAKALLGGSLASLGAHYVVSLAATNCATGEPLAREQVEAASKEEILTRLGEAASGMRRQLGESMASIQRTDIPLSRATTSSLEALKAFSAAAAARTHNVDAPEAVPLFKRAVELDPDFALAYIELARLYDGAQQRDLARQYARAAFDHRQHATDAEQLSIAASYYSAAVVDIDKSIETANVWTRRYPNDERGPNVLGVGYRLVGRVDEALDAQLEGVRRNPRNSILLNNLAYSYAVLNRFAEARDVLEGAMERRLMPRGHPLRYQIAFAQDDGAAMQREIDEADRAPRGLAYVGDARTAALIFRGQFRKARELASNDSLTSARVQAFGAAFAGYTQDARRFVERAVALDRSAETQADSAVVLALVGERDRAEAAIAASAAALPEATIVNRVTLPTARAALQIERGAAADAVETLRPAMPYEKALGMDTGLVAPGMTATYLRGMAFLKLKNGPAAAAEFRRMIGSRGVLRVNVLFPLASLGLGRALAMSGDADGARDAYDGFFAFWKDADADVPILVAARREYAALPKRSQPGLRPVVGDDPQRLVVLPFENLTRNAADDWLAGGFSDSLTFGLRTIGTLTLVNRERVVEVYRERHVTEAATLNPEVVRELTTRLRAPFYVHGTYQRVGDQIRVVARLVAADSGQIRAQESVTDRFENLLKVEGQLASRFAEALAGQLPAGAHTAGTVSLEAYHALTEARTLYAAGRMTAAETELARALAVDPQYAQAWALLSKAQSRAASSGNATGEAQQPMRDAAAQSATRAIEIDPSLYDAHVALALANRRSGRTEGWRQSARHAIALNPRDAEAYAVLADSYAMNPSFGCGRDRDVPRAEDYYQTALRLDPGDGVTHTSRIANLMWANRPQEALAAALAGVAAAPERSNLRVHEILLRIDQEKPVDPAAIDALNVGTIGGTFAHAWADLQRGRATAAWQGFDRADALLAKAPAPEIDIYAGFVYLRVGRASRAIANFRRAVDSDPACGGYIATVPLLSRFSRLPEFVSFVRGLK